MNNWQQIIEDILNRSGLGASTTEEQYLTITVNYAHLTKLLKLLRDNEELRFTILSDLFAADFPSRLHRFELVYNLLSLKLNKRIIVKTFASENEPVTSVVKVFSAAAWYEREIFDLFGIIFKSHPDLRRILTDYGFIGHPLRKDFPVTGHVQVRYDANQEKVIYEPVKLQQNFREFDFLSPWEGTKYKLPGDEKAGNKY